MPHRYYMCHREISEILGESGSFTGALGSVWVELMAYVRLTVGSQAAPGSEL